MRSSFWQGWTYKTSLVPQVYFNDFKIFFYNHTSQQYVLCTNQNNVYSKLFIKDISSTKFGTCCYNER